MTCAVILAPDSNQAWMGALRGNGSPADPGVALIAGHLGTFDSGISIMQIGNAAHGLLALGEDGFAQIRHARIRLGASDLFDCIPVLSLLALRGNGRWPC